MQKINSSDCYFTKNVLYTVVFCSSWSASLTSFGFLLNIQSVCTFTISQASTFCNYRCVNLCVFALWSVYNLMHSAYSSVICLSMDNHATRILGLLQTAFQHVRELHFFRFKLLLHCVLKGNIGKRTQILYFHSLGPLVSPVKLSLAWA